MAYLDENGLEHFWGKIKDHVSSAVAPKADDADVVHKTGDEIVQGEKVFKSEKVYSTSGSHVSNISIRNPAVEKGTATSFANNKTAFSVLHFLDSEGSEERPYDGRLAMLEYCVPSTSNPQEFLNLACYDYFSENSADNVRLSLGYDLDRIPYATAPETSDDRTNSADIVTRGYMEASEWNWQKTKKNALVQFKPAPESDLEPVVDFMFTETPPAEGEKGPENPSTITGVTQAKVTRCGKNLLTSSPIYSTMGSRGITVTYNADGSIHLNGTANSNYLPYLWYFTDVPGIVPKVLTAGTTITISLSCSDSNVYCVLNDSSSATVWGDGIAVYSGTPVTHTMSANVKTAHFGIYVARGATVDCDVYCQIEFGQTATEWEAPADDSYVVQFGDTYYGGSLDVATGVMTVTKIKITMTVPDASDGINQYGGAVFRIWPENFLEHPGVDILNDGEAVCDKLPYSVTVNALNRFYVGVFNVGAGAHPVTIVLDKNLLDLSGAADPSNPTAAEVRAAGIVYFTANPLHFVFTVLEPFTVQLTPTQIRSLPALDKYEPRVNTVYTDQEAVQVGYQRYVDYAGCVHTRGYNTITHHNFVHRDVDTGAIVISGGSAYGKGGALQVNGSGASSNPGLFILTANDDNGNIKALIGKPNGTLTWNGQPIQTTSDERLKTPLSEMPDAVLDAWEDVNWGQFQYLDAVAAKGDSARLHLGLIAQHVMSVFEQHGLDVCDYGILCHEERPAVDEEETVVDAEAYTDEEGVEHPAVTHVETRHEDAVDLWMVRYTEALALEAACQRRRAERAEARLATLEERLATLEAKLS